MDDERSRDLPPPGPSNWIVTTPNPMPYEEDHPDGLPWFWDVFPVVVSGVFAGLIVVAALGLLGVI